MGYLRYEGYMGSVEYDEKEECLYGHVQGLRDELLNYKGKSVAELEKNSRMALTSTLQSAKREARTQSGLTMVR